MRVGSSCPSLGLLGFVNALAFAVCLAVIPLLKSHPFIPSSCLLGQPPLRRSLSWYLDCQTASATQSNTCIGLKWAPLRQRTSSCLLLLDIQSAYECPLQSRIQYWLCWRRLCAPLVSPPRPHAALRLSGVHLCRRPLAFCTHVPGLISSICQWSNVQASRQSLLEEEVSAAPKHVMP